MKIAFFDTKPYDIPSFDKYGTEQGITFKYFETKLNEDTVDLANGYDAVCAFVNDTVDATVIDRLVAMNIHVLALRCAGFNNVDMKYAFGKIHVLRVPAYSPYAVAEHAMALLLTSIRRIHKAYIRSRDFNFSLSGLTGFDLYGKTVGVIGTGRIGRVFIDICRGFGMKILAYDKTNSTAKELIENIYENEYSTQFQEAITKYEQGEYAKAYALLDSYLTKKANDSYAIYYKALCLEEMKKPIDAIKQYKTLISNNTI